MRVILAAAVLFGASAGIYLINEPSPAAVAQPPKAGPPAGASADDPPRPPEYEELLKKAEPLPDPPKADASNEHKKLLPDGSLLLELAPDPADRTKKKPVRVLLAAEVCMLKGPLEVLLCKKQTKEHEAVVRTGTDAKLIHAALLAAGGKPGKPVQFVDPATDQPAYKPASGTVITVTVHYRKDGRLHTRPGQEWIRDMKTGKPMAHKWVFAGSREVGDPDNPAAPKYYAANSGEVICISNFPSSMLDLPVKVTADNADLSFEALTENIPPLLSKVWVILTPER
jgi:hypothetical protein